MHVAEFVRSARICAQLCAGCQSLAMHNSDQPLFKPTIFSSSDESSDLLPVIIVVSILGVLVIAALIFCCYTAAKKKKALQTRQAPRPMVLSLLHMQPKLSEYAQVGRATNGSNTAQTSVL
jgi:hypothetical protein